MIGPLARKCLFMFSRCVKNVLHRLMTCPLSLQALQACAEASEAAVRAEMLGKDTAADKLVDGSY